MSVSSSSSSFSAASQGSDNRSSLPMISADDWFAGGQRVWYDPHSKTIRSMTSKMNLNNNNSPNSSQIAVWERTYIPKGNPLPSRTTRWMTMLPGFPEGSLGYAKMESYLNDSFAGVESACRITTPRLYLDFVGQGDSDTPPSAGAAGGGRRQQQQEGYHYGTMERADLVQALWQARGVHRTVVVAVDYSALVVMELLRRQEEEEQQNGDPSCFTKIEHVLIINGSHHLTDTAAHKDFTVSSPLMRALSKGLARHSNMVIKSMLQPLFSKRYREGSQRHGMKQEVREIINAIRRRGGVTALARLADTESEQHRHADRWDLARILNETSLQARGITIHIVESSEEQRECEGVSSLSSSLRMDSSLALQQQQQHVSQDPSRLLSLEHIRGGHFILLERPRKVAIMIQQLSVKQNLSPPKDDGTSAAQPFWRFPAIAA